VSPEGKICALREVLLHRPGGKNIAFKREVEASHEYVQGNVARYAVDGNERGTYWMPGEGIRNAWLIVDFDPLEEILGEPPPGHLLARVNIFWRYEPSAFQVEFFYDLHWHLVYWQTAWTEDDLKTDFSVMQRATRMRISIQSVETDIGILEIKVWKSTTYRPPFVDPMENLWDATQIGYVVDRSTDTFVMSPPNQDYMEIILDMKRVYEAYDIQVWFGYRAEVYFLRISEDGVNWQERLMTSGSVFGLNSLMYIGTKFKVRYVKVEIRKGFYDEESMFGTTIKDLAVYMFRNLARNKTCVASHMWNFPPEWANDLDPESVWISRFGSIRDALTIDLGEAKNIGGMTWQFGYPAGRFQIFHSLDKVTWNAKDSSGLDMRTTGNYDTDIVIPTTVQFKARYIKLDFEDPRIRIFHPDFYGDKLTLDSLFSVYEIQIWEHTGGGGVFGLENLDGTEYLTVGFGLRFPGEWMLMSEQDSFTEDLEGGIFPEDVGTMCHIMVTVSKVSPEGREMALYRNGIPYGTKYVSEGRFDRLKVPNATRLVVGVRSSAHANSSLLGTANDPRLGVRNGVTHSPYFEGKVHNVTLLRNALNPEEVRGMYMMRVRGDFELGCHCADACPAGSNRFFPNVPVPCSGQGVCLRDGKESMSPGICMCQPGYSGPACESHCSVLSRFGCCEVDDDCPDNIACNPTTKACAA